MMSSKKEINDLALAGGSPLFTSPLHVGCPNIPNESEFLNKVETILKNKWLTNNGPFVQQFESQVQDILGVRNCIAVSNGTVGLEIAIRALGLQGEVIVPSLTFVATAHSLKWQEITPVFCDIDPQNYTINPSDVEKLITSKTTGILAVHLWGRPCLITQLQAIAEKHNLKLIFDASHAFGCTYEGAMVGNFGNAEVFSFHATKFINTLEGGAVVTNDDELAQKIRLMKNFGFSGYDEVSYIGINGKMNEVSAAMGITNMECFDELVAANKERYLRYADGLKETESIFLMPYQGGERFNYQYIVARLNLRDVSLTRDDLMNVLWAENVRARRYFFPGCHRMEPYKTLFKDVKFQLPNTEELLERVLVLPAGSSMPLEDIDKICGLIKFVLLHQQELSEKRNLFTTTPCP